MPACSISSCGRPIIARGLCSLHYERQRVANNPVCAAAGCQRQAEKRGMCGGHYYRWRKHGSPEGGRARNGAHAIFIVDIAKTSSQHCIIWPFARSKYGYGLASGGCAHRLVCEAAHGPPPDERMEAAHSCGNGCFGCVNPNHLRWITHQENMLEASEHGRMWKKLTIADILAIRELAGTTQNAKLAKRFKVSQSTVSAIIKRDVWAWL